MNTLPSLCFPPLYIPSNYLLIFFFNFLLCPSMTTNSHSNCSPCILSAHFHFCSPFTFLLFFLSVFISFCFTSLYCMAISICTYFSPFSFNLNKTKVFCGNKFVYHILSLGLVVSVCTCWCVLLECSKYLLLVTEVHKLSFTHASCDEILTFEVLE